MKPYYNDELQLVRGIKNNDASAFDALYWKYHQAVYSNIMRLVKDAEISKDILQDVFVALWTKRETLNPDMSIGGWLFVTSYHKSMDHLRRKILKPLTEITERLVYEIIDFKKQEEETIQFSLVVEQAISQLSPQKKRVFELCKLKGKTYEETARELNISKHTVKEYLSGALAHIRDYVRLKSPQTFTSILFFLLSYPPSF